MCNAKICVSVTAKADPCQIESSQTLFVYVLRCNGKVLEWCGRKFVGIPTKCGQVEIEVPPGCYVVGAVENPNGIPPLGNHLTHIQVVRVNCGDTACVTLFNPTYHHCAHWFLTATRDHLAAGGQALPREAAVALRNALPALEAVVKAIPQDPFTTEMAKIDQTGARKAMKSSKKRK
jgi:hypothetical protein